MEKTKNVNEKSSLMMTGNESVIYMVESFMEEHYAFRRNLLSGKTEMAVLLSEEETPNDEASSNAENGETSLQDGDLKWEVLTKEKDNENGKNKISLSGSFCNSRCRGGDSLSW